MIAKISLPCALLLSGAAWAWGPEGHAIVADIAEQHLSPAALQQVQALLALEQQDHLDDISSWADKIRSPATAPLHFVDIPLQEGGYQAERDCDKDACVVAKITYYAGQLADDAQEASNRLEALKWLVHFVGDIHQPLHAEDNNDRGGNDVKLTFFGKHSNLHSIWDGAILENALALRLGPNFTFDHGKVRDAALRVDGAIAPADRARWQQPGVYRAIASASVAWADESHALAPAAYSNLPQDASADWSAAYEDVAWPVVQGQLQKAGLRLAVLLNEIFR